MANIDSPDRLTSPIPGGEYGDAFVRNFKITLSANAAIGDVLRMGRGEQNSIPYDATLYLSAGNAGSTVSVGFVTDAGTLSDPAYFLTGQSAAAAGRFRANVNKPPAEITDSDFDWTVTVAGAVLAAGTVVNLTVFYKQRGHQ
jgi:hypothetical protein